MSRTQFTQLFSRRSNPESEKERFHMDTLWVAEVVPHLGLPVRRPSRRAQRTAIYCQLSTHVAFLFFAWTPKDGLEIDLELVRGCF